MKNKMATTANVRRFLAAVHELKSRPLGVEGMGLLWGEPGEGKSSTVAFVVNFSGGIFVRANSTWTVTSMLAALCVECRLAPKRFRSPMLDGLIGDLANDPRPIFVDEADYLTRQPAMLDALRDIYDFSGAPVILIGMEDMARKVRAVPKFARRITQWVEFKGITAEDARILADTVCEVGVDAPLLAHVHAAARGNIGRIVTALSRIESFGRTNNLVAVSLDAWGERPLFYDQPEFLRRNAHGR